jgi:hypothetical protein
LHDAKPPFAECYFQPPYKHCETLAKQPLATCKTSKGAAQKTMNRPYAKTRGEKTNGMQKQKRNNPSTFHKSKSPILFPKTITKIFNIKHLRQKKQ